jgi:soluble lytic murein transglycosylase
MPMDIWVETIPYKETRNYVKAVMAYKQIYSQRLGQQSTLFADLTAMQIPSKVMTN